MTLGMMPITLEWNGAKYTIPADRMMPVIEEVETILERNDTRYAVQVLISGKGPSIAKLAMCFAAMLRHAGASVSDQEVFMAMQSSIAAGDSGALMAAVREYAAVLLSAISPPIHLAMQAAGHEDAAAGKSGAAES